MKPHEIAKCQLDFLVGLIFEIGHIPGGPNEPAIRSLLIKRLEDAKRADAEHRRKRRMSLI